AEKRRSDRSQPRRNLPPLSRQHRRVAGSAGLPLRRMLHPQPRHKTKGRRSNMQDIKEVVKEKYGQAALRVAEGGSSCCGASRALEGRCDPITSNLYDAAQTDELPEAALKASLGCGNPTLLAALHPGETVLDL